MSRRKLTLTKNPIQRRLRRHRRHIKQEEQREGLPKPRAIRPIDRRLMVNKLLRHDRRPEPQQQVERHEPNESPSRALLDGEPLLVEEPADAKAARDVGEVNDEGAEGARADVVELGLERADVRAVEPGGEEERAEEEDLKRVSQLSVG